MKRLLILLFASVCLATSMTSCYTTELVAPRGKEIRLAQDNERMTFEKSHLQFWFLFGAIPINEGGVDKIIVENDLKVVRFTTSQEPINILLNILFNALIPTTVTSTTVTVEGKKEDDW